MSKSVIKRRLRLPLSKRFRGWVRPIVLEVHPLSPALVERLRKSASAIEKNLGKMENVDHRWNEPSRRKISKAETGEWGRRVRQMNIERSFPGIELVIKKSHYPRASNEISIIRRRVQQYNKNAGIGDPVLLEPIAEAISDNLIAMPKVDAPAVQEVLAKESHRGQEFFKRIRGAFGVSESDLRRASQRIFLESEIKAKNVWLLGFRKGNFVFMAMPDAL